MEHALELDSMLWRLRSQRVIIIIINGLKSLIQKAVMHYSILAVWCRAFQSRVFSFPYRKTTRNMAPATDQLHFSCGLYLIILLAKNKDTLYVYVT